MLPRDANLNGGVSAKEYYSVLCIQHPASILASSSIKSFQVQISNSFKRCQGIVRGDVKGLDIQVRSDCQFTHGIAVGTT